jgi:pilus assembly protein Flp/PilA
MLNFLITLQALIADRRDRDDEGATMVEYGLMVALIAVIVAVAVGPLGTAIAAMFDGVTASI